MEIKHRVHLRRPRFCYSFIQLKAMALICLALGTELFGSAEQPRVFVVRTAGEAFSQVLVGIREELGEKYAIQEVDLATIGSPALLGKQLVASLPNLVVLMDNPSINMYSRAAATMSAKLKDIPVVVCMGVGLDDAMADWSNAGGVAFEVPIVTSVVNWRSISGKNVDRLGVVHREFLKGFVEKQSVFCESEKISVVTRVLSDSLPSYRRPLRDALTELIEEEHVDAIWVPNDNVLLTTSLVEEVWRRCLRKHEVPAIVGVEPLVHPEVGLGTYAVMPDLIPLGVQVGAIIRRAQENGWRLPGHTVEPPLSVKTILNVYQAQKFFTIAGDGSALADVLTSKTCKEGATRFASAERAEGLSLGNLLNASVTSVSKREEPLLYAPSSIYVITKEDIRRSGATRLIDVLALAPGVWSSDNSYDLTTFGIRELPDPYPQSVNMLLDGVPLIDGFLGLSFEGLQISLSEIERIEVIRGPGGTIYGANSATGIVNIITKDARESVGAKVEAGGSNVGTPQVHVQAGKQFGDRFFASVYSDVDNSWGFRSPYFEGDSSRDVPYYTPAGTLGDTTVANRYNEENVENRLGILAGGKAHFNASDLLDVDGTVYFRKSTSTQYAGRPVVAGKNYDTLWVEDVWDDLFFSVLRASFQFSESHKGYLKAFYSRNYRHRAFGGLVGTYSTKHQMVDLEWYDVLTPVRSDLVGLEVIYGANARQNVYEFGDTLEGTRLRYTKPEATEQLGGAFVQTKLSLAEYVDIITGVKGEVWTLLSNKPEFSPSAKIVVKPMRDLSLWGGYSRSITTPSYLQSRIEIGIYSAGSQYVTITSLPGLKSTEYQTVEGGFRALIADLLMVDFCAYYSRYTGLIGPGAGAGPVPSVAFPGETILPLYYSNLYDGAVYGGELLLKTRPIFDVVRLEFSGTRFGFRKEARIIPGTDRKAEPRVYDSTAAPSHIFSGKTYLDLPWSIYITCNWQLSSPYRSSFPYEYSQQFGDIPLPSSVYADEGNRWQMDLDLTLEKRFWDDRVSVLIYGKNLLRPRPYLENYEPSIVQYPHTKHAVYGGKVGIKF